MMRALVLLLLASTALAAPFDRSTISDWTKPPAAAPEPKFTPPVAKRMKLANGIALLVVENHALPIVAFDLVVPGAGAGADPVAKGGLAAFTADMLDEGAGGMSALEISAQEDRLGAAIFVGATTDAAYVSGHTLTKTLDQTIELVTAIITKPTFAADDFQRVKGDRATSLELRRDRPREVASLMLVAALYGADSPIGHPVSGIRETFKTIELGDLEKFYREHWNPAAMTLVVAGDVDAAAVHAKLDAAIGAWKPKGVKAPAVPAVTVKKPANRLLLVDRKDAAQSDVRIGLVGLERKDKRYYAFEVLATTLGGGFTSRLTQRLREQLGITYGAGAAMEWAVSRGPFIISTAIVTKETAHGLAETFKILDDLATTDVPAAELEKSKQNLIRALPSQFDTNASTAGAFADLALFGLPDDWYAHYADNIRKVTAADVKALAKAAIPAKQMVITIVGDMAKVRADIDALKLGSAEMHDLYGALIAK